jgi:Resolvase, N terminal domain
VIFETFLANVRELRKAEVRRTSKVSEQPSEGVDRGVMRGRNGAKMIFWVDLVVWRLDRLGHSLQHQINTIDDLRKGESSLNPFRTTSIQLLRGKLAFHLTAAISEFETDLIRERTRAGLSQQESGGDMVAVQRPQVPKRCKS